MTLTEFWKLNAAWNVLPETIELRIWMALKYEGKRNDHMLHYEQVFGNVFERRESKCCGVLMKHCRKVKG